MNTLRIEIPAQLAADVAQSVARLGVSESAWLEDAVRAKLDADAQLDALAARAARGDRAAYDGVLANVPAAPPEPGDGR